MSPRRASLGVVLGVLLVLLLPATPASAHAVLERTDPVSGAVLDTAPGDVVITFSEPVRPVVDRIRITGPDGKRADAAKATAKDRQLRIPLKVDGPQGTYLVSFRVISSDSHPISGGFSFSIGQVTSTPSESTESGLKSDPVVSIALSASRYISFAGLILLIGPALMLFALWPRRLSTAGPARLATVGLGLLTLGTVAELYLQIPYTSGSGVFGATGSAASEVMSTPFGAAHLVRLGVIAAAGVLLRPVVAGKAGRVDQTLLIILAVVGLATWPISGHPSASPVPSLTVVADVAHLAAMSVWLGGLVVVFTYLLRQASDGELRAILPIWSGWAMFAVSVLVLAGTAQALVEIGTISALTGTTYGRLVLVKVGLLAVVLTVAAYSRRLVNRQTEDTKPQRKRLRTGVIAEVAVAAVVLGVTSALVQTTPARTAEANANQQGRPFSITQATNLFRLEIDVAPATKGTNTIHLFAYTPDGLAVQTVAEWSGTAALPAQGVEPISIPLLAVTPDHASGQVELPTSGTWQLRITVRTDETHQASVIANVPIK